MTKTILIATAALALGVAFGASKDPKHNDVFIPGDQNENHIAQEVRHQLVMLPYYGIFDDIAFRVEGSKVTLLGAVTRPTLKSDAENVTKRVEGVTQVDNRIEVLPLSSMDDQIRIPANGRGEVQVGLGCQTEVADVGNVVDRLLHRSEQERVENGGERMVRE